MIENRNGIYEEFNIDEKDILREFIKSGINIKLRKEYKYLEDDYKRLKLIKELYCLKVREYIIEQELNNIKVERLGLMSLSEYYNEFNRLDLEVILNNEIGLKYDYRIFVKEDYDELVFDDGSIEYLNYYSIDFITV